MVGAAGILITLLCWFGYSFQRAFKRRSRYLSISINVTGHNMAIIPPNKITLVTISKSDNLFFLKMATPLTHTAQKVRIAPKAYSSELNSMLV